MGSGGHEGREERSLGTMHLGGPAIDGHRPVRVIGLGNHEPTRGRWRELIGHPLGIIQAIADKRHPGEWRGRLPLIALLEFNLVGPLGHSGESRHALIHPCHLYRDQILGSQLKHCGCHRVTLRR